MHLVGLYFKKYITVHGPLNVKVYFVLVCTVSPIVHTNAHVPSPSLAVVTSYSA